MTDPLIRSAGLINDTYQTGYLSAYPVGQPDMWSDNGYPDFEMWRISGKFDLQLIPSVFFHFDPKRPSESYMFYKKILRFFLWT